MMRVASLFRLPSRATDAPVQGNLVDTPGFYNGAASTGTLWQLYDANTTVVLDSTSGQSLGAVNIIIPASLSQATGVQQNVFLGAAVAVGQVFTLSCYVKRVAGTGNLNLMLQGNSDGSAFGSTSFVTGGSTLVTGTWVRVSVSMTVTTAIAANLNPYLSAIILTQNTNTAGDNYRLTAVQVERGMVASEYVTGAISGLAYFDTAQDGVIVRTAGGLRRLVANGHSVVNSASAWAADALGAQGRFLGRLSAGVPSAGQWPSAMSGFNVGDFYTTADGHVYVCTGASVAGSAGTWVDVAKPAQTTTIIKTALQNNATTTLANDTVLTVALGVGKWRVDARIAGAATTASDLTLAWVFTGTATSARFGLGPGTTSATISDGTLSARQLALTTAFTYGTVTGAYSAIVEDLYLNVTVAGTLTLRFAQGVSDASPAIIGVDSRMYVTAVL